MIGYGIMSRVVDLQGAQATFEPAEAFTAAAGDAMQEMIGALRRRQFGLGDRIEIVSHQFVQLEDVTVLTILFRYRPSATDTREREMSLVN